MEHREPIEGPFVARAPGYALSKTVFFVAAGIILLAVAFALPLGVDKGIKLLSKMSMALAALLLFDSFAHLPAGALLSGIAVVPVSIFFITSADSGTFVMDMIAHKGDPNPRGSPASSGRAPPA